MPKLYYVNEEDWNVIKNGLPKLLKYMDEIKKILEIYKSEAEKITREINVANIKQLSNEIEHMQKEVNDIRWSLSHLKDDLKDIIPQFRAFKDEEIKKYRDIIKSFFEGNYLSTRDIVNILGISVGEIKKLIKTGNFVEPSFYMMGKPLWLKLDFLKWVEQQAKLKTKTNNKMIDELIDALLNHDLEKFTQLLKGDNKKDNDA